MTDSCVHKNCHHSQEQLCSVALVHFCCIQNMHLNGKNMNPHTSSYTQLCIFVATTHILTHTLLISYPHSVTPCSKLFANHTSFTQSRKRLPFWNMKAHHNESHKHILTIICGHKVLKSYTYH